MGAEEVETDVDLAEDATVTADKNVVPLDTNIADPTATVWTLEWIARHVPMDTIQTWRFSTAKEIASITALDGVGRRMMTLKVK